jgi:hypothetical protein
MKKQISSMEKPYLLSFYRTKKRVNRIVKTVLRENETTKSVRIEALGHKKSVFALDSH